MSKVFIALSLLAVAVIAAPSGMPTAEEAKAELLASGVSAGAVDGILKLASDFFSQRRAEGTEIDRDAARAAFNNFVEKADEYIQTQSESDQTAYAAFVANKKADFEARVVAGKSNQ